MNTFRLPLPNGMMLTLSKSLKPWTAPQVEEKPKVRFKASMEEMQDISVALLYYKGYLKQKGQMDRAEEIKQLDDKIFTFLNLMKEEE
jgi:hypothetical protein